MYLTQKIIAAKKTKRPNYGMTADGYTKNSGAPTSIMIMLENEKRWRRVMIWQFSNLGTLFVKIKRQEFVVFDYQIDEVLI